MYAENRINDFEYMQMQQSLAMMYNVNNGWSIVQQLNSGRWNGVSVAAEKRDVEDKRKVDVTGGDKEQAAA
jgi:hypothetical protein